MGLFDFIGPASGLLFTLENIIWINLGVFIGCVFAAIPGLSVILCIILFLPVTYTMRAIPGMMFLLGIYCAGGYGGSVSAILINTPGTPHAAATMLDGHPLSKMGRTKAALKIALYASTFDEPVKLIFHLQVHNNIRVLFKVHRLHLQHLGTQSLNGRE